MREKLYPNDMLPDVDYQLFGDNPPDDLMTIERAVMQNLCDVLHALKEVFLKEKMEQTPKSLAAQLCGYLGFLTVTCVGEKKAFVLQTAIAKFIQAQAQACYELFLKYPVYSQDTSEVEKLRNLSLLVQHSPGTIFSQTVHLGHFAFGVIKELEHHHTSQPDLSNQKKPEVFCTNEEFQGAFLALLKKISAQTKSEWKGHFPIVYLINQISIQLAWLMGHFARMEGTPPTDYLEYGMVFLEMYIEYGEKYANAMIPIEKLCASLRPKFH